MSKVPISSRMRQRLDAKASELHELTDELSVRLLDRTEAPIAPYQGYVRFEIDTFVMNNSDTKNVGRTYQGVDGYRPIAGYLGNEGWNIGLELRAGTHHSLPAGGIEHYRHHGTHEQFLSELKSDLDLERPPSGKFDPNDAIPHLEAFAYNCLRLIGQLGLTGETAPVRHPAKRRQLKKVPQEIMYRAARFVANARRRVLYFDRNFAGHIKVFVALQDRLL